MALEVAIQNSVFGIPFPAAYFRISHVGISRKPSVGVTAPDDSPLATTKFVVNVDLAGYATSAVNDNTQDIAFRRYHAPLDEVNEQLGTDFLSKCYAWVANQPDMDGAVPV